MVLPGLLGDNGSREALRGFVGKKVTSFHVYQCLAKAREPGLAAKEVRLAWKEVSKAEQMAYKDVASTLKSGEWPFPPATETSLGAPPATIGGGSETQGEAPRLYECGESSEEEPLRGAQEHGGKWVAKARKDVDKARTEEAGLGGLVLKRDRNAGQEAAETRAPAEDSDEDLEAMQVHSAGKNGGKPQAREKVLIDLTQDTPTTATISATNGQVDAFTAGTKRVKLSVWLKRSGVKSEVRCKSYYPLERVVKRYAKKKGLSCDMIVWDSCGNALNSSLTLRELNVRHGDVLTIDCDQGEDSDDEAAEADPGRMVEEMKRELAKERESRKSAEERLKNEREERVDAEALLAHTVRSAASKDQQLATLSSQLEQASQANINTLPMELAASLLISRAKEQCSRAGFDRSQLPGWLHNFMYAEQLLRTHRGGAATRDSSPLPRQFAKLDKMTTHLPKPGDLTKKHLSNALRAACKLSPKRGKTASGSNWGSLSPRSKAYHLGKKSRLGKSVDVYIVVDTCSLMTKPDLEDMKALTLSGFRGPADRAGRCVQAGALNFALPRAVMRELDKHDHNHSDQKLRRKAGDAIRLVTECGERFPYTGEASKSTGAVYARWMFQTDRDIYEKYQECPELRPRNEDERIKQYVMFLRNRLSGHVWLLSRDRHLRFCTASENIPGVRTASCLNHVLSCYS